MKKNIDRAFRVADLLHRELAMLLQKEMKDPRIGMTTITDIKVSRDLCYAKVYFTCLQSELTPQETEVTLNHAKGFLRSMLAKNVVLRNTPELQFIYDDIQNKGHHLDQLIEQAVVADQNLHRETDKD